MDIGLLRKSDRDAAQPLGRLGFQLLLASASARQASSRTARAVVLQALAPSDEDQPDQSRIRILSNRQQTARGPQQRLARFSDIALPQPYAAILPVDLDLEAPT